MDRSHDQAPTIRRKQNGAIAVLLMLVVLIYFIDKNLK